MIGSDAPIEMKTDWSNFSLSYTCLILLFVIMAMVLPRDTAYIQKVNAFGVVFVIIFLLFVIYNGIKATLTTDYVYSEEAYNVALADSNQNSRYSAWVPLFGA